MNKRWAGLVCALALMTGVSAWAQQIFDTATKQRIRVVTMATGLVHPWSMAILPDVQTILVAERAGRLRIMHNGVLAPKPIWEAPAAPPKMSNNLLWIAIHPRFNENRFVYLSYPKWGERGNTLAVARGRLGDDALSDVREIFVADAWETSGNLAGRIMFGPDQSLYVAIGDRDRLCCNGTDDNSLRMKAQDLSNDVGKVLRLKDDGSIPPDNPFVGHSGARGEVWAYGVRNAEGLAFDANGQLWEQEHGPKGGDEINIIEKGKNYGWPVIGYGVNYDGAKIHKSTRMQGMEQPAWYWTPSIAPSGMTFYSGKLWAAWRGDLFSGALKYQLVSRLKRIGNRLVREERLLQGLHERIRDVREGPDGALWLLTDNSAGRLLRVTPSRTK